MFIRWPFKVVQLRAAIATPYFISIPVWAHHLRGAPWSIIPDERRRLLCHFSGLLCLKLWYISSSCFLLTHWGRVTHICVGNLTIIGPDNGLSPPSHYLNQCWNIVNWTLRNKLQWNLNRNSNIFIQENAFESVVCEMASISSRPQWVLMGWRPYSICFYFMRSTHLDLFFMCIHVLDINIFFSIFTHGIFVPCFAVDAQSIFNVFIWPITYIVQWYFV